MGREGKGICLLYLLGNPCKSESLEEFAREWKHQKGVSRGREKRQAPSPMRTNGSKLEDLSKKEVMSVRIQKDHIIPYGTRNN